MGFALFAIKGKRRKKIFLPLLFFIPLFIAALADYGCFRNRVYPGVYVKQMHLGGQSPAKAASSLARLQMTFFGPGGETISFPLGEMGIFIDSTSIFREAYQQGRKNRPPRAYLDRLSLWRDKAHLPLRYFPDEKRLRRTLLSVAATFNRPPRNAFFQTGAAETEATLTPEQPGYRVAGEELFNRVLFALELPGLALQVPVPYQEIPARVTILSFKQMGISGLMSSFTTYFDLSKAGRVHNIKLAASILDGYIVSPGEIFSLNNIIGDTTPEKGYREAPVIVGEELVPGYGGGLCQISSTLYNAALLANLEIIERHNHNLTVFYLPPGRDATIEYGARDLKFENNTGHHLLIYGKVKKDALTFSLFGPPGEERVEISTVELAVFPPPVRYEADPALPPGAEEKDEGSAGYIVEVWKTVYREDRVISKEIISVDRYAPYPTVIRRGPR